MAQAIVQTKLAQIKPTQVAVPRRVAPVALSRRQKAAIIVRLMLAEGSPIPLSALPDGMQAELAQQIGQMRRQCPSRQMRRRCHSRQMHDLQRIPCTAQR